MPDLDNVLFKLNREYQKYLRDKYPEKDMKILEK